METFELFQRLSLALAIGFLIGLERGWQARNEPEGGRAAGLRTHALAGLLGGVWAALAGGRPDGLMALGLVFATFSVIFALFRYREARHEGTFGATSVVAMMLAVTLGAVAVAGNMAAAAASGVAVAALLASKAFLHGWVQRLSWTELRSGLLLLAMSFILLPVLPNVPVDPWGMIVPFDLWMMTVLIAAISFAGYIAVKLAGDGLGIFLTGVAGGLASSTAVTVTMAQLAREHPGNINTLMSGSFYASATSCLRVLAVVFSLGMALLPALAVPLGLGAAVFFAAGVAISRVSAEQNSGGGQLDLKNPFEMATVLKFGALLTAVTVLAKVLERWGSDAGLYVLAAISGIADVDAITLSMTGMARTPETQTVAANAILLAVAVNAISKAALGWAAGGAAAGRRLMLVGVLAVVAGAAGYAGMN